MVGTKQNKQNKQIKLTGSQRSFLLKIRRRDSMACRWSERPVDNRTLRSLVDYGILEIIGMVIKVRPEWVDFVSGLDDTIPARNG